jgi:hypothetical protein
VKQDGTAFYEIKRNIDEYTKTAGLQFVVNGTAYTQAGTKNHPAFNLGLEYNGAKARAKVLVNAKSLLTDASVTYLASNNFVLGTNAVLNLKGNSLDKFDWGLNW